MLMIATLFAFRNMGGSERLSRAIDATADPAELRLLAKQLLQAWHTQKAATHWLIRQQVELPFAADPRP